jgi:hypothetical protein
VLVVQLRSKRARTVPVNCIANGNCPVTANSPGKFVEFVDSKRLRAGKGLDALDTAAEIADFIERIPGGHLQDKFTMNVGNIDGDVEKMLRRLSERNVVRNCCVTWHHNKQGGEDIQEN